MTADGDYNETYARFWAGIIDAPGVDREDKIRRELHDYTFLMEQVPSVYDAVSGGRISKPNTMAFEVIGQFEQHYVRRGDVVGDLRAIVADASDFDELRKLVSEYADRADRPE